MRGQGKSMKRRSFIIIGIVIISLLIGLTFGVINIKAATAAADKTRKPLVNNNARMTGRWLRTVKERPALTSKDKEAKAKIISPLSTVKNKSGYLVETKDYKIEYVSNADEFFVEILTPNTQYAKYWATMWFKSKGVSEDGICKLPVVYYPNLGVANKIKDLNIEFNPLADNCI